jgi:phage N-6-adenine-methyltransferase
MAYIPKSKSDKWGTPTNLYNELNKEFNFNYDPCPIDWKEDDGDGLLKEWGNSVFCNPPYSNVKLWIKKASEEHNKGGKLIVMLINTITDTLAFHEYIYNKPDIEIRFIKGRLKFINPEHPEKKNPNVKPSMIIIFKKKELGIVS